MGTRLVMVVLVAALTACGRPVDEAALMEAARGHLREGEHRQAMIVLKQHLSVDPDNGEARRLLAEAYLGMGQGGAAREELMRARAAGVPAGDLLSLRAQALMLSGDYRGALTLLEEADGPETEAAELAMLRGELLLALGQAAAAREAFSGAMEFDAAGAELGMIRAELAVGPTAQAEQRLRQLLQRNPQLKLGWVELGRLEAAAGRADRAAAAFGRAVDQRRGQGWQVVDVEAAGGLILALIEQGRLDAVDEPLEAMRRGLPRHPAPAYLEGLLAARRGEPEQAARALAQALERDPDYRPALLQMAKVSLAQGNPALGATYADQALALNPEDAEARRLLAACRLREAQPAAARAALAPLLGRSGEAGPLTLGLAAAASLLEGEAAAAVGYLEQAVREEGADPALWAQLAAVYLAGGRRAEALEALEALPEGPDELRSARLRVQGLLRAGEPERARAAAEALAAHRPEDPAACRLAAAVALEAGAVAQARRHLQRLVAMAPKDVWARSRLAALALRDADLVAADGHFRALAAGEGPEAAEGMLGLAAVAEARGRHEAARDWLSRARQRLPASSRLRNAEIAFWLRRGDAARALALAEDWAGVRPDEASAHNARGVALMAMGKAGPARESFARALALAPDRVGLMHNLARAALVSGDSAAALEALDGAHRRRPDDPFIAAALAEVLIRRGDAAGALEVARGLQTRPGAHGAGWVLEGDIHMSLGAHAEAAAAYGKAMEVAPEGGVVLRLYRAERAAGRRGGRLLKDWLQGHPEDLEARLALAQSLHEDGRLEAAAGEYQTVLEAAPEHPLALNNLAWLRYQQGKAQALELASRAYALAPGDGAVADTLGWILLQYGHTGRAVEVLRSAHRAQPAQPTIGYHLAVALFKSGQRQEAARLIDGLLSSRRPFPEREAALELARRLAQPIAD